MVSKQSEEERPLKKPRKLDNSDDSLDSSLLLDLPIKCEYSPDNGESVATATLCEGWFDWAETGHALLEKALAYANTWGGRGVCDHLGTDYDQDRARAILAQRGWIDVEHFSKQNPLAEKRAKGDNDEEGWNVRIRFGHVSLEKAMKIVDSIFLRLGPEDDVTLPDDVSALRQRVHSLINNHCQQSSLLYAKVKRDIRHPDYPLGGEEDSLMWRTTDNRSVALNGWREYQVL